MWSKMLKTRRTFYAPKPYPGYGIPQVGTARNTGTRKYIFIFYGIIPLQPTR